MALLILSFAVGGLLQILAVAASQRRTSEVRRLALQEVANQAEHIALLPWGELTDEQFAGRKPSDELLAAAPMATLTVTRSEEAGPPVAARIYLAVQWTTPAGDVVEPVELTMWRYQPTEARP
jgi:Tfp pilus assembly protein PilV